jgi:ankyrin repeat protein
MAPTINKQNPPHLSIHHASYTANIGLISYALSSGVSPNALLEGFTPLHLACAGRVDSSTSSEGAQDSAQVLEAVKLLIGRGADVNAKRLGAPGGSASAIATGKWKVGGSVG